MSTGNTSRNTQRQKEGNPGCGCLVIILIVIGIAEAGVSSPSPGTPTSPGADTLRTAGNEAAELYHRVAGDGEDPGEQETAQAAPTPTPRHTSTPAPAPTPMPLPPPDRRHYEYKTYMLELINAERNKAGVPPVTLGDNIAAQLHAEASLENCTGSHWGVDGLKPYMRYSLAGGYQANGENWLGSDYCIKASDRYRALGSIEVEVLEAMEGWMDSPGHRRNILEKWHKKVNIGLAWDKYNFVSVQHFEGDYVEYDELPTIKNGVLSLAGRVKNGAAFDRDDYIDIDIYYDPPPHNLTRGQLSRTYCYDGGLPVAYVRKPLSSGWFYNEDEISIQNDSCPDPYSVAANAPPPASHDEAHEFWQRAYDDSQSRSKITIWMQAVTASEWKADGSRFSISANLGKILDAHGSGVYTVMVRGNLGGENEVISQYPIFHGVEPPDTYDPGRYE